MEFTEQEVPRRGSALTVITNTWDWAGEQIGRERTERSTESSVSSVWLNLDEGSMDELCTTEGRHF